MNEDAKPKRRFKLKNYLDYLKTTWTFFFAYPERGKVTDCEPNYEGNPKNYILDPFVYYALYTYINNIPDPFKFSTEKIKDSTFRGLLVESVVASHLLLSQQIFEHMSHTLNTRMY